MGDSHGLIGGSHGISWYIFEVEGLGLSTLAMYDVF